MNVQTHYHSKDRSIAVSFSKPQHCAVQDASPAHMPSRFQPTRSLTAQPSAPQAQQTFSPLVQDFLDECGYSDK